MSDQKPSYNYQKPSTLATRTLVSGSKPVQVSSSSSHDTDRQNDKPQQGEAITAHYQQAVSNASNSATSAQDSVKPVLERQQSWKQSDIKRDAMEKILTSPTSPHGYSSTAFGS